jgi:hypothetical protein
MKDSETELAALAQRLRARVAEGRYAEARGALQEYSEALRKAVAGLAPDDPGRSRLKDDWEGLREETRRRLLARRAHAEARLARLPKLPLPYRCGPEPRRTWQCLG